MNTAIARSRVRAALLGVAAAALVLAGCSGGAESDEPLTAADPPGGGAAASPVAAAPAFPTGPAVMVSADYAPPTDRVDRTGAFLPANGKPTLVFVDAIW